MASSMSTSSCHHKGSYCISYRANAMTPRNSRRRAPYRANAESNVKAQAAGAHVEREFQGRDVVATGDGEKVVARILDPCAWHLGPIEVAGNKYETHRLYRLILAVVARAKAHDNLQPRSGYGEPAIVRRLDADLQRVSKRELSPCAEYASVQGSHFQFRCAEVDLGNNRQLHGQNEDIRAARFVSKDAARSGSGHSAGELDSGIVRARVERVLQAGGTGDGFDRRDGHVRVDCASGGDELEPAG